MPLFRNRLPSRLVTTFVGALLWSPLWAEVSFNFEVRPIFSKNCIACHGPDAEDRKGDLRLDTFEGATADLGGYAAIVPGSPNKSTVVERIIQTDPDEVMPPSDHGHPLSPNEVAVIKQWISEGAKYETHWSFAPLVRPAVPRTENPDWAKGEIDAFILQKLETAGLHPSPPADPVDLLRRMALDLTGLPPTLAEVAEFKKAYGANKPAAIAAASDRLLASPAYGEHWASMWLDMARYADTVGYASDEHRDIWPWRDWVIKAFNDNMPYNQFALEQVAGDLLPNATTEQKLATAFHRLTLSNNEGGTNDEEFRTIAVKDRISTTLNSFMGLTMRCAECHTHKYDPISHTEYYQFYAFFNQTADQDHRDDRPRLAVMPMGREREKVLIGKQIEGKKRQIEGKTKQIEAKTTQIEAKTEAANPAEKTHLDSLRKQLESLRKQLADLEKKLHGPLLVPVMEELPQEGQRKTRMMTRGSFLQLGEEVSAEVPSAFGTLPQDAPQNRLGVARWLVADENPLTARVVVNRYWARLFGLGIVETEEDFGTQGMLPTHPELLDWLAVEFRESGWDTKKLLKTMVMSAAYQQSSPVDGERLEKDPRNLLLSRGPRHRLSAEVVRDQALAASGLLSRDLYGPPVYPPTPVKRFANAFSGDTVWTESQGPDRYRRALYTYLKRSNPHPLFETFDMASRDVCVLRRFRTNTPLQSFMTLNDTVFVEASQALARKMAAHSTNPDEQVRHGVRLVLLKEPTPEQLEALLDLQAETLADYVSDQENALKMAGTVPTAATGENAAQLATLTVIANVLLNLDGFLCK